MSDGSDIIQLLTGGSGKEPLYANHAEVTHNSMEIKIRFNKMSPHYQKMEVELILPPIIAKALVTLLVAEVDTYEQKVGPIYMPDDMSGILGLFGIKEGAEDDDKEAA